MDGQLVQFCSSLCLVIKLKYWTSVPFRSADGKSALGNAKRYPGVNIPRHHFAARACRSGASRVARMRHGVMASPIVSAAVCARASSGPRRRHKVRVAPRTRGSIPRITATERHRAPGDARAAARDGRDDERGVMPRDGRDDERGVMPRDASARSVHGRVALGAILASTLATVLMPESADAVETTAPTSVPSLSGRRAALDPRERYEPTGADGEREQGEITLAGDAFRFLTVEDAPEPAVDDGIAGQGAASSNAENDPSSQIKIDAPSLPEQVAAAVVAFLKPLLGEFGAAVLGFGVGAVASGFFMGWQQSKKSKGKEKTASRQALADLATMDESEIQELVGELPAWLAFRDVERAGSFGARNNQVGDAINKRHLVAGIKAAGIMRRGGRYRGSIVAAGAKRRRAANRQD